MIFETVLPVFLIIAIGYILGFVKKIDTKQITDLLIYISAPCLIFTSIAKNKIGFYDMASIAVASALIIIITGVGAYFLLKLIKKENSGLVLPMTFSNTAFLGYPVILMAYGAEGFSRAVIPDMVCAIFMYSIGIYLLNRKHGFEKIFRTPLIYAVILGIAASFISISSVIMKPLELIGSITIPLALLMLGYRMKEIKIVSFEIALGASIYRILGGFLVSLLVVKLLSITGIAMKAVVLQASMPSAIMTMVLCQKFEKEDAAVVATTVLVTTLMGLVALPLILNFLK
ncbi:AEC family transporter [Candidatus Woesearchaeota archaeon]|nr:AEC family transporter [Candidatus Woesearchaeota archaeon]